MWYTIMEKLLEIGGYLNKGYNVFVDIGFMSVPLVRCLHQLSTYMTGTVRRNRKLLPQQFKNKLAVGQKMYCRSSPLLVCVFGEKKSPQKILSFFSPARSQPKKWKYGEDMMAVYKLDQKSSHPAASLWVASTLQT
jgi:hypothetical protein